MNDLVKAMSVQDALAYERVPSAELNSLTIHILRVRYLVKRHWVGLSGLEPLTSALSGRLRSFAVGSFTGLP